MIQKILIANRGEIALRVMRSAREMGIKTVAVFSEADRLALHVRYADEAVCIGPPPSSQSYLNIDKVIAAAKLTGADAIHPGYGFLSENPVFARKVKEAGITFIGPTAESMEMMGDKIAAKKLATKLKVPLVPGTDEAVKDIYIAKKIATEIGFPLLIKAAAGGGGKGMRIVANAGELEEQLTRASSEALSAFGDGSVFIEKYISSPRHIEIQILADNFGNVLYLFERECSIQRRHQKVVEEAPSSLLTPELRVKMGECAVVLAKACNYSGAGTIEFLMDENMNFYFLEMNTRLQVEHPVTEQITGIDLVKEQIKVASGEKLSITQNDLIIKGHAIEIRICAEDPENNFLPDTGTLTTYKPPQGFGIRVDDGFEEGMEIPVYYDPLIGKLITFGNDREEARVRMIRAISDFQITGVETTLPFCKFVMEHEAFISGNFDTNFVKNHFTPESLSACANDEKIAALLAAYLFNKKNSASQLIKTENEAISKWKNRKSYEL